MNTINTLLTNAKSYSQLLLDAVARHPQRVSVLLAALLLGGGGGAFAVANLGPDVSNLPVQTLVENIETPNLQTQIAALEQQTLKLYRNDVTRASDTAESLLRRMGLVDAAAAEFIRKSPEARHALLSRSGHNVSVEANEQQQLITLTTRWLKNDNDSQFQRIVISRTAENKFTLSSGSAPLTASVRMTGGTVASSLYAASDEARLPDSITHQLADVFLVKLISTAISKKALFSLLFMKH